jgi:hypothetical protein
MNIPLERNALLRAAHTLLNKQEPFSKEDKSKFDAYVTMVELLDRQPVGGEQ